MSIKVPTYEDYYHHDGLHYRHLWKKTGDTWTCPGCGRTKYQIMRWAKRFPKSPNSLMGWIAPLHRHHDHSGGYFERGQPRFPQTTICDQCNAWTTNHQTIQALVRSSKKLPGKITEITGITQQMLDANGEPLADVMHEFIAFVGNDRLVTFNAEFDMAFLHAATTKLGLEKLKNPVSCALKMARRAWPKRKSYRLSELASDGQFASGTAHRALEDARCALIVYAAAVAELKKVA